MDRVAVQCWDNAATARKQRASAVEAALLSSPCPFRARVGAEAAGARLLHAQVAESSVMRFRGEAQAIERSSREVASATPDNLAIVAFDNDLELVDDGRRIELRRGDLYVYHPSRTLTVTSGRGVGFEAYCVALGLLQSSAAWASPGATLARERATTRLLNAVLAPLPELAHELAPATFLSTLQHAASLVATELGDRGRDRAAGARNLRLPRALTLIAERHRDASFSVSAAAHELGCSVRLVHQMFEPTGRSFGAHLLEARLRTARALLQAQEQGSVTRAAFASGFNDLSTFHRAFRRMFGVAPRALRAQSGA